MISDYLIEISYPIESDWNAHGYMDSGMSMKWVYTEYVVLTCTVMKSSPRCTLCRMLGIKCYHGKKKVHLNMFINTWTIFGMVNKNSKMMANLELKPKLKECLDGYKWSAT